MDQTKHMELKSPDDLAPLIARAKDEGWTELNLSYNSISDDGAKAIAASLKNLTTLDLSDNSIGDDGAKAIAVSFKNLTTLDLSDNSIGEDGAKAIAASLKNLTSLDLSDNSIGDDGAKAIAASLKNLTSLDLSDNSIGDDGAKAILDAAVARPQSHRFRFLWLQENGDLSALVPDEVLAHPDDPEAILAAYRRLVVGDKRALNEAKLLVVGNEAVGKTSLLRYLIDGRPRDPAEEKTSGIAQEKIETESWPLETGTEPDAGDIRLNVWDFGGQEMMRGTHRFFLTARSLYLLVLEDRREDDRSIHDWLKTIRNRGADSPILVVINKSDEGKQALRLDEVGLRKEYPEIVGFLRTSCNDDDYSRDSIQTLRETIVDTVAQNDGLKHVRDGFAPSWLRIKDEITALAAERAVLPLSDFQHLCEQGDTPADQVTDDDERRLLLRLLNDLGTIVAHGLDRETPRVTQDITLLDPNWLTGAVYQILNHPTVRDQQGEFTREQWVDWLDPEIYPKKHHDFILDMMRDEEVGLCFRLPTAASDERYLIPEALPASKPDYKDIWPEDTLRFRYHYDYLPPGLIPRFIVQAHRNLTEQKTRWRQGALFAAEGCKILVEANIAASPKRIDIQVCGPNERRRAALAVILNELGHVHALNPECGAKPRVPLPDQPEHDVSYDHLLTRERQHGSSYIIDPEGADRTYTVAELLDGVRHEQRPERYPKDAAGRQYIAENMVVNQVYGHAEGDVTQAGIVNNAAPPKKTWADALTSWRFFALAAATAAVVLALILYLIPSWELRLGIAALAALFVAVYLKVAAANPDRVFRRWIARTILAGLAINIGGVAFDAFMISDPATLSLTWDGTVSFLFNIAWPLIVIALAALERQRMQQAGKMSPA